MFNITQVLGKLGYASLHSQRSQNTPKVSTLESDFLAIRYTFNVLDLQFYRYSSLVIELFTHSNLTAYD